MSGMTARKPSGEILSGSVLAALQQAYPEVVTGGWRQAVWRSLRMASRAGEPREFVGMIRDCRFEPDAYVVNASERFLHFFEVEVYNPMTAGKLSAYAKMWSDMAYYGVEFAVLVVNKYGHINSVPMQPYYFEWIKADPRLHTAVSAPHGAQGE